MYDDRYNTFILCRFRFETWTKEEDYDLVESGLGCLTVLTTKQYGNLAIQPVGKKLYFPIYDQIRQKIASTYY